MFEIFKTSVNDVQIADKIVKALDSRFPDFKANFDLEDCDKILRVHAKIPVPEVKDLVESFGCRCELLE